MVCVIRFQIQDQIRWHQFHLCPLLLLNNKKTQLLFDLVSTLRSFWTAMCKMAKIKRRMSKIQSYLKRLKWKRVRRYLPVFLSVSVQWLVLSRATSQPEVAP